MVGSLEDTQHNHGMENVYSFTILFSIHLAIYKSDPKSFIFTLKGCNGIPPVQYMDQEHFNTIYCNNEYGPTFATQHKCGILMHNSNILTLSNKLLRDVSIPFDDNPVIILDYEVLCIDYENRYTIDHLCKYPDIVWNYIQTKDIPEELLQNVEEEQDLLNDLNLIQMNDDNIRLKVLRYLKNPSQFLPNTKIVGNQYDNVLREWIGDYQWKLLYRASEHEYTPESFHKNCDGKSPTLIIIKSTDGWIFGGYTTQSWNGKSILLYL